MAKTSEPRFQTRMLSEIRAIFGENGVTSAPYRILLHAMEKDPDCPTRYPLFSITEQSGTGTYLMPSTSVDLSEIPRNPVKRAPV